MHEIWNLQLAHALLTRADLDRFGPVCLWRQLPGLCVVACLAPLLNLRRGFAVRLGLAAGRGSPLVGSRPSTTSLFSPSARSVFQSGKASSNQQDRPVRSHNRSRLRAGAPDSMNIVFGNGWQIVVDDMTDILDIQSTGCDVCRNQSVNTAFSQVFNRLPTFILAHVTVQRGTLEILSSQYLGNLLRSSFCCGEHE